MLWVVGDVHGLIPSYEKVCQRLHKFDPEAVTIQVGDMGVGFKGVRAPECGPNDFWIAGNHDDALVCEKCPGNLGDFGVRQFCGYSVFFMRGAMSTDRAFRTEGESWWAYEELTDQQLDQAVNLYRESRPEVVVTHDCPRQIRDHWFKCAFVESRTVDALSRMLKAHQPLHWALGHHHHPREELFLGTHFICVNELQEKKIPVRPATSPPSGDAEFR